MCRERFSGFDHALAAMTVRRRFSDRAADLIAVGEAGSGVLIVPWLSWFMFLGPGALVTGAVVAATVPRRPSWLVWQAIAGIAVIVLAWRIGEWTGAYEDENPEGCSDCGTTWAFALVAMFASCTGWAIGTAIGGAIRFILGRSRLRG
jgi:hypothetical protein